MEFGGNFTEILEESLREIPWASKETYMMSSSFQGNDIAAL